MQKTYKYDVVIIGGGTSGCACAYNCAKKNLKTLLIEKNNFLGGLMTGGLVVPIMKSSTSNLNNKFYKKLISTAKKYNAQITYMDGNDGWLNPEMLKIVLDDILTKPKIKNYLDILFETSVTKVITNCDEVLSVDLISNLLSLSIEAKYFVDATGSGEFSKLTGCNFLNDTQTKQQNSLRFILGNVDFDKFSRFIEEIDLNRDVTNTNRSDINCRELHFTTASTWDTNKKWALDKYLKKGVKDGVLKNSDRSYFQIFSIASSNNQVAFNCPRINNYLNNPFKHSKELIKARQAINRLLNFVRLYFPGFENAILTNIATQTGIREQNRLKTKYIYKKDDILIGKTFETPALEANYPIDIHSNKKNKSSLIMIKKYQLPIEALMSADYNNLFGIGKLVGAEFSAHSALRVQKSCMSMGEALANHIY